MPDPTETPTPWPSWLAGLTPAERVNAIVGALDRCSAGRRCADDGEHAPDSAAHLSRPEAGRFLLRLLGEARQAGYESAFTEAMDAHRARIDQVAGPAESAAVPSAEQPQPVAPEPVMALLETGAALVRNLSMRPGTGSSWDAMAEAWQESYRALAAEYAAGTAEPAAEPGPDPDPGPPLPPGFFGRVELPGWRNYTGWFTSGGGDIRLVSDWDGNVIAEFVQGPNCLVIHLPTPQKRPDPPKAITAAPQPFGSGYPDDEDSPWGGYGDDD